MYLAIAARTPNEDAARTLEVKALSADIHKNLAEPRRGIRRAAEALGVDAPRITAAVRTGDTPASERAAMLRRPPHITRYAVALIGRPTRYSIERARHELGWEPRVPPREGLRRTLEWYFGPGGPGAAARPAGLSLEGLR